MANGDPFLVGVDQPPDNRCTSVTMLVHTGSSFGTQHTAFYVLRNGSPRANAAIRGDNVSTGGPAGVVPAGVQGTAPASTAGIGVLGGTTGGSPLFYGDTGVMGAANSFGVVGKALVGLVSTDGALVSGTGVVGQCDAGIGVRGTATSGFGVIGESSGRAGVTGTSVSGVGVDARSQTAHGVQATTRDGVGVLADSTNGDGVLGRSQNGNGVRGVSQGMAGVYGQNNNRYGVFGEAAQGIGVYGTSRTNAIQGVSTGSGGASIGVSGVCDGGVGVQGSSRTGMAVVGVSANGWAGAFIGNVVVRGAFYVMGAKSAAVPHPDGSTRALFCLESTESFFEDFGEVSFAGASVVVPLDRDFAALIRRDGYQVFLTCYGPETVYVRERTQTQFEIARVGTSRSVIRVGYRIVARRGDLRSSRLPRVNVEAVTGAAPAPGRAADARRSRGRKAAAIAAPERLPARPKVPSPKLTPLADADRSAKSRRRKPASRPT